MTDAAEENTSKILEVADMLDAFGEGGHSSDEDARETAMGLRFYADDPDANSPALRELLTRAVDTFTLGTVAPGGSRSSFEAPRLPDKRWGRSQGQVEFPDNWGTSHGLLGHEFFRLFTVAFRAADFELEIEPISE